MSAFKKRKRGRPPGPFTGKQCGAETSHGACKMPAGWGTDHKGEGLCRHCEERVPMQILPQDQSEFQRETCGWPTPMGPCQNPAGQGTDHFGQGRCTYHEDKSISQRMPQNPILLSLIPQGLDNEIVKELMRHDADIEKLVAAIAVISGRLGNLTIDQRANADVQALTQLTNALSKLIVVKADLQTRKQKMISMEEAGKIIFILVTTFYEVVSDEGERNTFIRRLKENLHAAGVITKAKREGLADTALESVVGSLPARDLQQAAELIDSIEPQN